MGIIYFNEKIIGFNVTSEREDHNLFLKRGEKALEQGKWTDASIALIKAIDVIEKKEVRTKKEIKSNHGIIANIRVKLGNSLRMMGKLRRAKKEFELVKEVSKELGEERLEAEAMLGLGFVAWRMGKFKKGKKYFSKAIEIGESIHDDLIKGRALTGMGSISLVLRDLDEGVRAYEEAIKYLKGSKEARQDMGRLTHNLAFLYFKQGSLEKAERTFRASMAIAEELEDIHTSGFANANLAHLYIDNGDLKNGKECLERAGLLIARTNDRIGLNLISWVKGILRFKEGDIGGALNLYEKAAKGFEEMGLHTQIFHLTVDYIPVFRVMGREAEAFEKLEEITSLIEKEGHTDLLVKILDEKRNSDTK